MMLVSLGFVLPHGHMCYQHLRWERGGIGFGWRGGMERTQHCLMCIMTLIQIRVCVPGLGICMTCIRHAGRGTHQQEG
jgi:hypothetical protein